MLYRVGCGLTGPVAADPRRLSSENPKGVGACSLNGTTQRMRRKTGVQSNWGRATGAFETHRLRRGLFVPLRIERGWDLAALHQFPEVAGDGAAGDIVIA